MDALVMGGGVPPVAAAFLTSRGPPLSSSCCLSSLQSRTTPFLSGDPRCLKALGGQGIQLMRVESSSSFSVWRQRPRRCLGIRADAADREGGAVSGTSVSPSQQQALLLEQNRRLLRMQKELLEQIEERKKLHSAMMSSSGPSTSPFANSPPAPPTGPPPPSASSTQKLPRGPAAQPQPGATSRSPPPSPSSGKAGAGGQSVQSPKADGNAPGNSPPSFAGFSWPPSRGGRPSQEASPAPSSAASSTPSATPRSPYSGAATQQQASVATATKVAPLAPQTIPSSTTFTFTSPRTEGANELPPLQSQAKETGTEAGAAPPAEGEKEPTEPPPPPLAGPNVMNVVVVASECAPWSKTGGLGDVVGALPKALARRGHRVMVVAPRYSDYQEAWDTTVRKWYNVGGQDVEIGYFHGFLDGVDFVFIDTPIFHCVAGNIYGGSREDVQFRMTLLCKAAIEAPWHVPCGGVPYGDANLVFVANDWHTALIPVYLQAYYRDRGAMEYARSVLVIHNMAHQGRGPLADFDRLGLPPHYKNKFHLWDPVGGDHMNIFMAGLITAQQIVAVSHGYAWECQTPEGGWGLDGVMRDHNNKLRGVVNGIDTNEWNPEIDGCLKEDGYVNYSIDTLEKKAICKAALQKELGLPVRPEVPLIGFIGRLDYQKGVDIIRDAMPWMMDQDLQLVLLGSGRADLENMLREFEGHHRDKCRGWVGFSVKTAHRITAGADILLMPSRFEPCGLNQLYAMRYGTVPVVHSVGGLRDTVSAFDPFSHTGLGWTFDRADAAGLIHALGNCMWTYRDFKDSWVGLQKRGMSQDLSWDNAAQQYEDVFLAAKYTW
eukprot:TRINITY_DN4509_c0_g1_i1.p1 TRINITY_DN4509_c0_g1~~TRINITY_DN4509_c0_g1_i1.p1  ORF type:complete len:864 (+),score=115.96 TRINITY_DN4509_c0_g1_i1:105-2594(+)